MTSRFASSARRALPAALCLALGACATTGKYEASLNSLIGRSNADLVALYGQPSETFDSGDHAFLAYISWWTADFAPLPNITGSYPNYTKSRSCTTVFDTKDGVVVGWAIKGNACADELAHRQRGKS